MNKKKTVKRLVSKVVLVGLLISSLPATLSVRAKQAHVLERSTQGVQSKLSKEEVDKRIRIIKKTINIFKIVNVVVPLLIAVAGTVAFFISIGIGTGLIYFGFDVPKSRHHPYLVPALAGFGFYLVAIASFFVTPVATVLFAIGLTGATIVKSFAMARELEQMEKNYPGTLTTDQKKILVLFKQWAVAPVTLGIMKYFTLKKALKTVVADAIQKNPSLTSIIPWHPKKTRAVIAKFVKLSWLYNGAKKGLKQLSKEKDKRAQRIYKKAEKQVENMRQRIAKLQATYPGLMKFEKELAEAEKEFGQKVRFIFEGLKKPVLKKPKPVVVPL